MDTKNGILVKNFMDKELGHKVFVVTSSWESLMAVAKEVLYYEQTYAYDNTESKGVTCVFENITEKLMEMNREEFEKAILLAIKWLNINRV
jgi:aspartate/tyrosine/aromatic aminotransferase